MGKGFNVQEFKSVMDRNGSVRSANKFLVEFPVPRGMTNVLTNSTGARSDLLSFYCKASALPGLGLLGNDFLRYGYGPIEKNPHGVVVNDIMMMFYVDGKDNVRTWFNEWVRLIVNYVTNKGINSTSPNNGASAYQFAYKENYAVDISITTFTNEGKEASRIILNEAYPNFTGDVMLDWDAKNQIMIMPVAITFRDWYEDKRKFIPSVDVINPETGEPYPKT